MTVPVSEEDQLDSESLAYELAAEAAVTAALAAWVAVLVSGALRMYEGLSRNGPITSQSLAKVRTFINTHLATSPPLMRMALTEQVEKGFALGKKQGAQIVSTRIPKGGKLSGDLEHVIDSVDKKVAAKLATVRDEVKKRDLSDQTTFMTVVGLVNSTVGTAQADTRWSANRALNEGVARVAEANGNRLMWVNERNACLHCLAYAGLAVDVGDEFPAGLTFADKALPFEAVPYPPLHPHCRCRVEPYDGPDRTLKITDLSPASALYREARRSVVKGQSAYASEPARLRAADRLIEQGASLPKTVVARAAEDVRRGSFSAGAKKKETRSG